MLTHKNLNIGNRYLWIDFSKFPTPTRMVIVTSPAQWLSAGFHYLFSAILKYTRLQTSAAVTPEHFGELVDKYKPPYILISPTLMTTMMSKAKCDFNCFENVLVGGSAVTQDFLAEVKKMTKAETYVLYGMSEVCGNVVQQDKSTPLGSYGRQIGGVELKLVDPKTNEVITEPHVPGEIWFRGPSVFKGYYNNEEMTKETLTEDGWLKSGDILYRDEAWNLFFVDRYKLLLKYRNHQVSPSEVESVIMKHPGVFQVAVTGIPDRECGDLVVACVVPKPGCSPTAQEIKDLVKETLKSTMVKRGNDAVHWYMEEVGARVVAKTGIPSDRHHLGKLILHSLQDDPDFILQIDGATGESETFGSALDRSIRCAVSLTNMGLKQGDVMVLMGPNHIDYCIPHTAGLFLGLKVASIDATLCVNELKQLFETNRPKIIFAQTKKLGDINEALSASKVDAKIVTFDNISIYKTMTELLNDADEASVKKFQPTDFDPSSTIAFLTSTSGTTGIPKTAMITHENLAISLPYIWKTMSKFPSPIKISFVVSPAQWITTGFNYIFSPVLKFTRLQTSKPVTPEHFGDLVNKYRPNYILCNPVLMRTLAEQANCDFTCFEQMSLAGSYVSPELVEKMKKLTQSEDVFIHYGMSELSGTAFVHDCPAPPGSCGRPAGSFDCKLVDPETHKEVTEPHVQGELWFKGPAVFKGYHNNPEVTRETFSDDGWFRCGDIFYRDESWNVYFVERYKSLLKYNNHQVSPLEVEMVIMKHPGVLQVAVTGIPDRECGDLVVACVVPKPGCSLTAQEIKDLVKENLTDTKHLRGGVIFMKSLPITSASKINRQKLKELALTMRRE
ncbi:luciferin 4-monooxygenase-like isoform X11 [Spodoptera frugiperda]|nr:luciferin 4-monooxygenase-like isoform X11 [Spodoptera frugiperda]